MISALALASSEVSLSAPWAAVSPFSRKPAGSVHNPSLGAIDLRQSKTLFSWNGKQPVTTLGF